MVGTKHSIERCSVCQSLLTSSGKCPTCGAAKVTKNSTIPDLNKKAVANKKAEGKRGESKKNQTQDAQSEFQSAENVRDISLANPGFLFNKTTKERFELARTVSKVGRDRSNNISISADRHVSRYHAWILHNKGKFWVEDLSSTNGTLLNGQPVTVRMPLAAGDRIMFGKTELIFVVD